MDSWQSGVAYERFMGRWTRLASAAFVHWLDRPAGGLWIDVGMGTGALTQSILDAGEPARVIATLGAYAAHPTTKGTNDGVAHPDWPGEFERAVEERSPPCSTPADWLGRTVTFGVPIAEADTMGGGDARPMPAGSMPVWS